MLGLIAGCAVLDDRYQCLVKVLGKELGPWLSLVQCGDSCYFVHWAPSHTHGVMHGQCVTIDATDPHIVKYPMNRPDREPVQYLGDKLLVHPVIDCYIQKDKADRPRLPDSALNLKLRWELGICNAQPPIGDVCMFCEMPVGLFTCPLCMCTTHASCTDRMLASHFRRSDFELPPKPCSEELSPWFDASRGRICVCSICWAAFA